MKLNSSIYWIALGILIAIAWSIVAAAHSLCGQLSHAVDAL